MKIPRDVILTRFTVGMLIADLTTPIMPRFRCLLSCALAIVFASCATEPVGKDASAQNGPNISLEETVAQAAGIYLVALDHSYGPMRYIIVDVWRHVPALGATPAHGAEFSSDPRGQYGTSAVAFVFRPSLVLPNGHRLGRRIVPITDGYLQALNVTLPELKKRIATTPYAEQVAGGASSSNLAPEVIEAAVNAQLGGGTTIPTAPSDGQPRSIVRPRLVSSVPPVYPFVLRRAGVQGQAVVDVIVGADGGVREAHAVRATDPLFGAAAENAVRQWRYTPGPEEIRFQVPVLFTLGER
jgi:TonB family protein